MSKFEGKNLTIEIYGQSHDKKIGAKVKGMPSFSPDMTVLREFLDRRKPSDAVYSTARSESDIPEITGFKDRKLKKDFEVVIQNKDVRSEDYNDLFGVPRPSHADFCWHLKDRKALDYRGGGRFSGRMTAPLCVVGGLCKQYLEEKGIYITAYVSQVGGVKGLSYKDPDFYPTKLPIARSGDFPSLDKKEEMLAEIANARKAKDSVGGRIECVIEGMPGGIGDCLFDGLEGKIAELCFAVPAVKGVEFGTGFDLVGMRGSEANDQMHFDENEKVVFNTNNSGGILGGISTGNYISFAVAMKPTPSIGKTQQTVNFFHNENVKINIKGRHDACIAPRAVPVIESVAAIALLDELLG